MSPAHPQRFYPRIILHHMREEQGTVPECTGITGLRFRLQPGWDIKIFPL